MNEFEPCSRLTHCVSESPACKNPDSVCEVTGLHRKFSDLCKQAEETRQLLIRATGILGGFPPDRESADYAPDSFASLSLATNLNTVQDILNFNYGLASNILELLGVEEFTKVCCKNEKK